LRRNRQKANVPSSSPDYTPAGMPEAPGDQTFRNEDAKRGNQVKPAVVELASPDGGGRGHVPTSGQHASELEA
jgi:hypothetical protein